MKKFFAIMLLFILAFSLLTACTVNVGSEKGGGYAPSGGDTPPASQGADSTPPGGTNNETGNTRTEDVIVMFNFEDEEHKQAVLQWLQRVLPAEDYYAFIDGEDYNAPYDFDDESPAWHEEAGEEE